ncbi:Dolichyl-diphosphooligosaccharide--protein glycosyltransferase subunit WBP1 [Leucosporidium creatinivorum]|uniref:Dolichyl-diphosphooligosaccharide--protein glycosyltransferase subunit WBP1 n=1 Tax=Leucosporidium creatinivorum TaxID=106004 RepID=A0A1Y2CES5_9BASI|nr:Dolichyl-diphosphooligosaccharide--protein glycosyltransferase subunit WBP1 [Leucosporidium creatinivorum]
MLLARLAFAAVLAALAVADYLPSSRILVVSDDGLELSRYALFWSSLRERGYDIAFKSSKDAQPPLRDHDTLVFDHLILFAPSSKSFPPELSPQSLYSYVKQGANLLVVLSPDLSEFWRDFAREFDIDFDDRGHLAIDHFTYSPELDDGSHTTLLIPLADAPTPFISPATRAGPPLLYRGTAHAVGRLPLLTNILHAPSTAYSYEANGEDAPTEDLYLSGSTTGLVSALQAKNNARISFVGSLDLFSDAFASAPVSTSAGSASVRSGNTAFIADLTRWTFGESGLLRVEEIRHARTSDGATADLYRVGDELVYDIDVSALQDGSWHPYLADDLQLEFTMLDPHLRLPLTTSSAEPTSSTTASRFSARFHAPDRHGVFTFKVDYRRAGWSFIDEKTVVSITPPRHDQYERFITGALPYYGGAASVSVATIGFVVLWLLQ